MPTPEGTRPATSDQQLVMLDGLLEVVEVITQQARDVIRTVAEDDQVALLEGITAIEVGAHYVAGEVDRARNSIVAARAGGAS